MSLFKKKTDDHAGSGIDKPAPKTLVEKVVEAVKDVGQPGVPTVPPVSPKVPAPI